MEEAKIGERGEKSLIYYLNYDLKFRERFVLCVKEKLRIPLSSKIVAKKAPRGYKSDILICDETRECIGLSLKTIKYGRPDDHLDRRWLDKSSKLSLSWKDSLQMPDNVYEAFKRGIMQKAICRNADLILPEDKQIVEQFLLSKLGDFLEEVFRRGETNLKLFAIIEYEKEKALYVFKLSDIIAFIMSDVKKSGIKFGQTIRLGNFLWIQRKAGNSSQIDARLPKTDPKHPANQLQVKILPLKLKDEATKNLNFCKLELPLVISLKEREIGLEKYF